MDFFFPMMLEFSSSCCSTASGRDIYVSLSTNGLRGTVVIVFGSASRRVSSVGATSCGPFSLWAMIICDGMNTCFSDKFTSIT